MRGRRHRNRLDAGIQARRHAGGEDGRKGFGEFVTDRFAGVQEGALAGGQLAVDGAGDHVARRQLGALMIAGHEGVTVAVDQLGAFPAQGLGGQGGGVAPDVDGRGVELHELGIGDAGAGGGGQRQALADGRGRIGGHCIEAAQPSGRQDGRGRQDLAQAAAGFHQHPAHPALCVLEQGAGVDALAHLDVRRRGGRGGDRLHDGPAGLVALHPRDAGARVGRLQALREAAAGVAVEGRAELGQPADGIRPFMGQEGRHGRIGQARAGGDGVGGVQRLVVALGQGRGDPALGPG